MIYNDNLKNLYGTFNEISGITSLTRYKPRPTSQDYARGYITRYFAKKINEDVIIEIDHNGANNVNQLLYKVVNFPWRISGPRVTTVKNGIADKQGVSDQNRFEIDRIYKEEDVDLAGTLTDLLEFWQGK